jgi:hypothetical protein
VGVSRVVLCLVTLLLATGALAQQPPPRDTAARDTPPPAAGTAVIRGRVLVAGADRPLSRVEVRAFCTPLKVNKAVLTDGNGRYEIADLPAGRYTVSFSRANYVRASYGQRRLLGAGAPIEIANGQIVTRIDAALQRTGVVTGRIVDEFGDPMTGVLVAPMRYFFVNGERRMQPSGPPGMTNDVGEYRIHGLSPGRYFVSATFRNYRANDANDRSTYAPTYYPGTGNAAEAQRLTIAAGQTIPAVNMTLLPVPAVRVSGVAVDGLGRPLAGASVNISERLFSGMFGNGAQVEPDGTFTIPGVPPGNYTVRAFLRASPEVVATADVTVSSADVKDVQIVAVKPSSLRGRVVFEAGGAKRPAPAAVRLNIVRSTMLGGMQGIDAPREDWTFEMKTAAGHILMRTGIFGGSDWRLKRVLSADGVDVTDAGFEVPANATVDGLVIELTAGHAEVSGTVVDAAGASVRDCVVVLFAQDQGRWTPGTRYYGVGRPDAEDVFHVRIPAGDYYAAAFELDDPAVSLNDPDILQQLRDRATRLSIGEAEKKTLALTLSEPPVY